MKKCALCAAADLEWYESRLSFPHGWYYMSIKALIHAKECTQFNNSWPDNKSKQQFLEIFNIRAKKYKTKLGKIIYEQSTIAQS